MKSFWIWMVAVLGMVFVSGCGGGGSDLSQRLPEPTMLFVNAVSDSSQLAFYVNDVQNHANLKYLETSPDFMGIQNILEEDGGTDLSVSDATTGEEIERDNSVFDRDTDNITIAYGLLNYGSDDTKRLQMKFFGINRRIVIGKARLMIFNGLVQPAGVDPRSITFRDVDPATPLTTQAAQYSRQQLQYGAFAESASVMDIDSGTRTFQARASDSDSVEVFAQTTYTFQPNTLYIALVAGQVDSTDPTAKARIEFIPITARP